MNDNSNRPRVIVDQQALLELVAELERRLLEYKANTERREHELREIIAKQQAMQTGQPYEPVPQPQPQYVPHQQFAYAAPTMHFEPETQHTITRVFDYLLPYFPSLWHIRPFIDGITWKRLLLMLIIIAVAANTIIGEKVSANVPTLKPLIDMFHVNTHTAPNQTQTQTKPTESCNATANSTNQTPTPAPQQ